MTNFDKNETYWNNRGRFRGLYDILWTELVPMQGKAETGEGELLRAIANRYYDLLNNGDCQHTEDLVVIEAHRYRLLTIDPETPVTKLVEKLRAMYEDRWGENSEDFGDDYEGVDGKYIEHLWEMFERLIDTAVRLVWKRVKGVDPAEAEKVANATSRGKGAVGKNALVPRIVMEHLPKGTSILDFGAGPRAMHVEMLQRAGFENVTGMDYGRNFDDGVHDRFALERQYQCVYASNVINTQSSWQDVVGVVRTCAKALEEGFGMYFIVNLPESPRKNAWMLRKETKPEDRTKARMADKDALLNLLCRFFHEVEVVGGTRWAPVYRCTMKRTKVHVYETRGPRQVFFGKF